MTFYGEFETDKAIRTIFPDMNYKGTFIEVGAGRPDFISLSRHFFESGWTTVGIEANPEFAQMHRAAGRRVIECAVSNYNKDDENFSIFRATDWAGYAGGVVTMEAASALKPYPHTAADMGKGIYKYKKDIKVRVRTLDNLFETEIADIKKVDVISIDVEGGELDVIGGFAKKELYPKVFVIECPYDNRAALEAATLGAIGYKLAHKQQINHFYVKA